MKPSQPIPVSPADRAAFNPPAPSSCARWRCGTIILATALVIGLALSGRSLWIDEACTAMKVLPESLAGWWRALSQDRSADLQMPLYMFYVWGWGRIFGTSEWSLHAANAPWFVAGIVALAFAFPTGARRAAAAVCVMLLSAFAWYYLDEARPYTMQLGASLMVAAGLMRLGRGFAGAENIQHPAFNIEPPRTPAPQPGGGSRLEDEGWVFPAQAGRSVALFCFGLVVLSGSSLLGMVWAGAALATLPVVVSARGALGQARRYWPIWLLAAAFLLLFAGYYLWTLSLGARASASATTTAGSTMFIGYELLGFSGLGPSRLDLRTAGAAALRPHLAWLALYGASVAVLISAGVLQIARNWSRRKLLLVLCCAAPAVFILAVGCIAHFRVLGRHFTPFFAVLVLLLASGFAALWSARSCWGKAAVLLFCGLGLASCLSVRFAPRHAKDNYRAAAAVAKAGLSRGETVWWNAAQEGARYYAVPVTAQPQMPGAALLVLNPTAEMLKRWPAPQLVVASKPDVYDGQGALAAYLNHQHFIPVERFTAFAVWGRGAP